MTGRTGYTGITGASPMNGPEQITDVYEHFDPLIDASIATIALLPAVGNWVGREYFVEEDGSIRRWNGTAWKIIYKPRTAYVPTWANFAGSNTTYPDDYGYYSIAGGIATVELGRTFAASGTIAVGDATVSLPVASVSAGMKSELTKLGDVTLWDASAGAIGRFIGEVMWVNTTTARLYRPASSTNGLSATMASNQPFTWAVSDGAYAAFKYAIA